MVNCDVEPCFEFETERREVRVRLNYATIHRNPPPSTIIHHHPPPAKIYPPPPTTTQKMDHYPANAKIYSYITSGLDKLCHHPPPSTTSQNISTTTHQHPPPAKIYPLPTTITQNRPSAPITSQNISTTTHHHLPPSNTTNHQPQYIHHHQPQSTIYPSKKVFYKKNINNILKYLYFKVNDEKYFD